MSKVIWNPRFLILSIRKPWSTCPKNRVYSQKELTRSDPSSKRVIRFLQTIPRKVWKFALKCWKYFENGRCCSQYAKSCFLKLHFGAGLVGRSALIKLLLNQLNDLNSISKSVKNDETKQSMVFKISAIQRTTVVASLTNWSGRSFGTHCQHSRWWKYNKCTKVVVFAQRYLWTIEFDNGKL